MAIVSLALLGALIGVLVRYAWAMYRFSAAGVDVGAVPFGQLAIDIMELPVYALYGAAAGAALGLVIVLVDLVFFRPRRRYDWGKREVTSDGADTIIKQRRALRAEAYLEQRRRERDGEESER